MPCPEPLAPDDACQHARERRAVIARLLQRLSAHHRVQVDAYSEAIPVPAFGPRMVCTGCGMIGADARPNWRERYDPGQVTRGRQAVAVGEIAVATVVRGLARAALFSQRRQRLSP